MLSNLLRLSEKIKYILGFLIIVLIKCILFALIFAKLNIPVFTYVQLQESKKMCPFHAYLLGCYGHFLHK